MGRLHQFRKPPRTPRYTNPKFRRGPAQRKPARSARWFPAALVVLPMAAFTAVLMLPMSGGPETASAMDARAKLLDNAPRDAAALDAEQPGIAGGDKSAPSAASGADDRERARFAICAGAARTTCVVDGDTIWYKGTKIRIADLDTPEVFSPACADEAAMGRRATARLQALLNAGPFTLEPNPSGDSEDRYGRSLMVVTRGGESLGAVLVAEGLAEAWGGPRKAWC